MRSTPRAAPGPAAWRGVRRLLVVRADNIGDVVLTAPALRALDAALPDATLTLLASPAGAEAAPLLPWIDDVIAWRVLWQDLGALPFDPGRERALVRRLERGRFDAAIVFSSFSQTPHAAAFAACLAGIPLRAGCSKLRSGVLTHSVPYGHVGDHQAQRNIALVEALGFRVDDRMLGYEVPAAAAARARRLLAACGIGDRDRYVLFNPWASAPARTYPPLRGAEAMRRVVAATALPVVVTAHRRNAAAASAVAGAVGRAAVDLSGLTSVCEVAALVRGAALVVTGNTSVLHMADASGRPTLALYSGSDLESQWRPRRAPHRLLRRPTPCSPCYAIDCPLGLECLDLDPRDVADAALELLEGGQGNARTPRRGTVSV